MEVASVDQYLAAATSEVEKGNVAPWLWDRALAQAKGGRESAIPDYLRARATALRVHRRDLRTGRRVSASCVAGNTPAESATIGSTGRSKPTLVERCDAKCNTRFVTAITAICAGIVVSVLLFYSYLGSGSAQAPVVASKAAPVNTTPSQVRAEIVLKVSKDAATIAIQQKQKQELIARIDELRLAGNWNVLVLNATEWTRMEPGNAVAWNQLSLGYERLKQYDDAYGAATKAVGLAPGESLYWRNLGELDRELNLPEEALRAYEEAAALDDKDIHSLVQAGILNVRLARMPEARHALDRALAAYPEDPEVLCLKAVVARPPIAAKELTAAAKRRESLGGSCRDFAEQKDGSVAASSSRASQSAVVPRKR